MANKPGAQGRPHYDYHAQVDHDGIEEWIRAMYPEILRYCLYHCANRWEAEDATQDTFLKIVRYGGNLKALQHQRAFIYKIARNTCIDRGRKARPGMLPEELPMEDRGLRNAEENVDFMLLVGNLSLEQQELLLLRYQQGLTIREVAEALDIPLRTAQSRLRTALKALENTLKKEDGNHGQ